MNNVHKLNSIELYFYVFFIISVIVLGAVFIGTFSIRVYATIMMLFYLLFIKKNDRRIKVSNSYVYLYLAFVFCMGVSLYMNGEIIDYEFLKKCLSYYLVAFVSYFATINIITTEQRVDTAINILVIILFVTSVVTILQYNNNPIGWYIASGFGSLKETLEDDIGSNENLLNKSLCVGILRHSFVNAMYIATFGVLSLGLFLKKKNWFVKIVFLLISILGVVACFMTQQRSAFYCMIFAYLVLPIIKYKYKYFIALLLILPFFLIYFDFTILADNNSLGRLSSENLALDNARIYLWDNAVSFIKENLFWGGPVAFEKQFGLPPHNFFLNAFVYSGLCGGIIVIYLFFKIIIYSYKIIGSKKEGNFYGKFVALSLFVFLMQGLFHNESLVSGSSLIFILLALIQISSYKIDNI